MHPFSVRIANALVSYVGYIAKMIWPVNLAVLYPHPHMLPWWQASGACLLLISISIMVIKAVKQQPCFAVGWLWYIGTLVPVIGLVQVGSQAMADRYTYVPLIGIFMIISWGVPDFAARWRYKKIGFATAGAVILSILTAMTGQQIKYWKNSNTLFEHALDVTDNNYLAHNNLGRALEEQGRTDDAISHYTEALQINPDYETAHYNLGLALAGQGSIDEAVIHYTEALQINPDSVETHNNLGIILFRKRKIEEAIAHFQEALRINPDSARVLNNLKKVMAVKRNVMRPARQ
jgi:TolA-binding protein